LKKKDKKELLVYASTLGLGGLFNKFLAIPHSVIYAKYLLPEGYGVLQIIKVFISYVGYMQLGITQAMSRNIPRAYSNNNIEKVEKIKYITFSWNFFVTLLALVFFWIYYYFSKTLQNNISLIFAIICSTTVLLSRANAYHKAILKSEGKFSIIGKIALIRSTYVSVLGICLVYFYGLMGAVLTLLIDEFISLSIGLLYYRRIRLKFFVELEFLKNQIKVGILIFINRFSENLIFSLTILLIGVFYSSSEVGVFSFGLLSLIKLRKFSVPLRTFFYRKILIQKGTENKDNNYYNYIFGIPHSISLFLNTMLIGTSSLIYFKIIPLFLLKYSQSIDIILMSTFGLIIYNARVFYGQYLDTTNQLILRSILIFIGSFIGITFTIILLYNKISISYVAASCNLSFIIVSYLMIIKSCNQFYKSIYVTLIRATKPLVIASLNLIILFLMNKYNLYHYNQNFTIEYTVLILSDLFIKLIILTIINYFLFSQLYKRINLKSILDKGIFSIYSAARKKIKF
jgi:hypothetical protein